MTAPPKIVRRARCIFLTLAGAAFATSLPVGARTLAAAPPAAAPVSDTKPAVDYTEALGPLMADLMMALSMDFPEKGSVIFSRIPIAATFSDEVQFRTSEGRHYADFSSAGAVLRFARGVSFGPAYTLSTWIKLPEPAELTVIWQFNADCPLTVWKDQFTCFRQGHQPYASFDKRLAGWHHTAVTCDGRRLLFYLDGQRQGTVAYALDGDLQCIGNQRSPDACRCAGLDDVLLFGRDLTKEEIAHVMQVRLPLGAPVAESALVAGANTGATPAGGSAPANVAPNYFGTKSPLETTGAESFDSEIVKAALAPGSVAPLAKIAAADDMAKAYHESLVKISGAKGAGAGFVANFAGANCIITSASAAATARGVGLQSLGGKPMKAGDALAAMGSDIFRIAYEPDGRPLDLLPSVEKNAAVGDAVAVLAAPAGAAISGKILSIGANSIETDAPFSAESNGSPIVHLKTGRVIGVAAYVPAKSSDDKTQGAVIHRLGYRLDSVTTWKPVNWIFYFAQATEMENIEKLTADLGALLDDLAKNHHVTPGLHTNPAFQSQLAAWASLPRSGPQAAAAGDHDFIAFLKALAQRDVASERRRATYDHFQRELVAQQQAREEIGAALEKAIREARK